MRNSASPLFRVCHSAGIAAVVGDGPASRAREVIFIICPSPIHKHSLLAEKEAVIDVTRRFGRRRREGGGSIRTVKHSLNAILAIHGDCQSKPLSAKFAIDSPRIIGYSPTAPQGVKAKIFDKMLSAVGYRPSLRPSADWDWVGIGIGSPKGHPWATQGPPLGEIG
jgi:hypothetical protein